MEPRITDKRTIAERYGNKDLMNKKPAPNNKYKNVSKVVSTGKTVNDVHFVSDQLVAKRKGEMFKRIKSSTIVKLINQREQKETESIYNLGPGAAPTGEGEENKNMDENVVFVSVKESGERIDALLARNIEGLTRSAASSHVMSCAFLA